MCWEMQPLSEKTKAIIGKRKKGEDAVKEAFLLLKEMMEPYGEKHDMTYRYEHTLRVVVRGQQIADGEGWDRESLMIACLLHDIGYPECKTPDDFDHHQDVSAEIARIFLKNIGYDEGAARSICRAVAFHARTSRIPDNATAFELSVRDADDLDGYDIMRTYIKGGLIIGVNRSWMFGEHNAAQIVHECMNELKKVEGFRHHICATETAQKLWEEQIFVRKTYFEALLKQMQATVDIEQDFVLGMRNTVRSLIRSKDGISLYRVKSEGKSFVLKVFEKQEDTREIENYQILSSLGIPMLPLLGATQNAILLPDVEADEEYRLGMENDLSNPQAARAIARWYREFHAKGRIFLAGNKVSMYDETDVISLTNLEFVAEKTDTKDWRLWEVIREHFDLIRSRIDALPRTLTYNDFYWTNLIVSKDMEKAFMFDYNLLGKGTAYSDIRNVTSSLSNEAAEAFLEEYGNDITVEEVKADAFTAPLITLFFAYRLESFPAWAKASLEELKNGDILRYLKEWLYLEQ